MSIETVLATSLGVILGGLITWVAAWHYYRKAGAELVVEATRLKLTTDLVLYKLQYPDTPTQLKRNEKGEVTGLIVEMSTKKQEASSMPSNDSSMDSTRKCET